ncbi:16S rRNA (guanine(966)-N(2))-methyltransferase RsmD [Vibrio sp. VB16]|uniref:16S rRNA (guanine(966)-N(2))-methyltransferase RsmD n=1 Tax=Vibrio sp. VB16 TaxID=2785746 RepID=UPI00189F31E8|nr:16S rRNA (guanine(966)-N(2))-methyltransferase RsmD [Vibrio sp. VB16]UGA54717.1 16S rRNA (guanine(966)-N(2))-methyltransferase RsmD [Vibrio sp. VB16]
MVRSQTKNNVQKKQPEGSIRIIAGLWRGRKLPVFNAEGLRPTADRVKETLFNWIAQDVPHAKCLDLFAGSGGLGFEAASRQAKQVVMLELNVQAHKQLSQNITTLKTNSIEAINLDCLSYLEKQGTPFDIVFIDPPFRKGLLEKSLKLLEENNWLAENAMIYIETEKELTLTGVPDNWSLYREKKAGQVSYRLFERNIE